MVTPPSYSYSLKEPFSPLGMPSPWLLLPLCERPSDYVLPGRDPQPPPSDIDPLPVPDLVGLYFEDAFRRADPELLSHAEEIELSQTIEMDRLAVAELEARRHDGARSHALRQQVHRGEQATQRLITSNLRLVVTVATWYRNRALPLPDLIQEGNIGLMQAVEKYDWRRGTRFSLYAVWRIRQAITRSLANDSRLIRVPVHIHQQLARIAGTQRVLYHEVGREPSPYEIAEALELPEEQVRDLLHYLHPPSRLDALHQSDNEGALHLEGRSRDDEIPSTEEQACQQIAYEALYRAIEELSPQEQHFLERRFGLRGREARSLRAVGEALGISKGQAQTFETREAAEPISSWLSPKQRLAVIDRTIPLRNVWAPPVEWSH